VSATTAARLVLGASFVLGCLAFLPQGSELAWPAKAFVNHAGVTCAALILLVHLARQPSASWRRAAPLLPLLGLSVVMAVSAAWALDAPAALRRAVHIGSAALAFGVATQVTRGPAQARQLLAALATAGALVAVVGEAQRVIGFSLIPIVIAGGSTFTNPNIAAHVILLTMPALLWLTVSGAGRARLLWALGLGVTAAFLLHTQSRGAFIATGMSLAVLVVVGLWQLRRLGLAVAARSRLPAIAVAGAALALILVLPTATTSSTPSVFMGDEQAVPRDGSAPAKIGLGQSTSERLAMWGAALDLFAERPLHGVGAAGYKTHYPRVARKRDGPLTNVRQSMHPHNDALELLAEQGLLGALFAGWLAVALLRALFRRRSPGEAEAAAVVTVVAASLCGGLANAMISMPLARSMPPLAWALLCASLVAIPASSAATDDDDVKEHPAKQVAVLSVLFAVVFIGLFATVVDGRNVRSEWLLGDYAKARSAGREVEALAATEAAVLADPWYLRAQKTWGLMLMSTGKNDQAIAVLDDALERGPWGVSALYWRAAAKINSGRTNEGLAELESLLEMAPYHEAAWNDLIMVLLRTGRGEEARARVLRAFESDRRLEALPVFAPYREPLGL
jgi:O-antigen ligase